MHLTLFNLHQACNKHTGSGAEQSFTTMTCFISNQMAIDAVKNPPAFHCCAGAGFPVDPPGRRVWPQQVGYYIEYHMKTTITNTVNVNKVNNNKRSVTRHRMRNENFGLVAIALLLHFLSRDRLEADLHHGSVSPFVCRSAAGALALRLLLTIAGHPSEANPHTSSTDRPLLTSRLLLGLFLSLSTGSVLFFLNEPICP